MPKFVSKIYALLIVFSFSVDSQAQSIQKSTFSFISNSLTINNHFFVGGQVGQSTINDSINFGYLPLNTSFLNITESKKTNFKIFPNPFNHSLTIQINDWSNILAVELFAANGASVYKENHLELTSNSTKSFNLNHLNPGLYYILIILKDGGSQTEKIIKL